LSKWARGDRFAALEPIKQSLRRIRGVAGKDTGNGIAIRHDWGPQYIARDFKNELEFWGLRNSPALVHEPQTNGVIDLTNRFGWVCWIYLAKRQMSSAEVQLIEG